MESYKEQNSNIKKPVVNAKTMTVSKQTLILIPIIVALLIVPTSYMLTFAYYAFGTKSTTLMDTASKVLYLTEPNTALEEMEFDMEFSLFSMDLSFDQYKQVGGEQYPIRRYDLHFVLDDLVDKEMTSNLERTPPKFPTQTNQWLVHPAQGMPSKPTYHLMTSIK